MCFLQQHVKPHAHVCRKVTPPDSKFSSSHTSVSAQTSVSCSAAPARLPQPWPSVPAKCYLPRGSGSICRDPAPRGTQQSADSKNEHLDCILPKPAPASGGMEKPKGVVAYPRPVESVLTDTGKSFGCSHAAAGARSSTGLQHLNHLFTFNLFQSISILSLIGVGARCEPRESKLD